MNQATSNMQDPATPTTASGIPVARRIDTAVAGLPLDKRWLLGNKIKHLARIRRGERMPTRAELNVISSFTGDEFLDVRALLQDVDWTTVFDCRTAVRALRDSLGMARSELAAACGVDVSAISRIENGLTAPNRKTAAHLSDLARRAGTPDDIIGLFGVRNPSDEEALTLLRAHLGCCLLRADTVIDGAAVGRWLSDKRRALESGTCDPALKSALRSLGISARRDLWMGRYAELTSRCADQTLVFRRSDTLEPWVSDQRRAHAAGTLPAWKIELLELVPGWRWGCSKQDQWMASYMKVKNAAAKEGVKVVRRSWVTDDGFPAGDWVIRSMRRAETGTSDLDAQRLRYLAALPETG